MIDELLLHVLTTYVLGGNLGRNSSLGGGSALGPAHATGALGGEGLDPGDTAAPVARAAEWVAEMAAAALMSFDRRLVPSHEVAVVGTVLVTLLNGLYQSLKAEDQLIGAVCLPLAQVQARLAQARQQIEQDALGGGGVRDGALLRRMQSTAAGGGAHGGGSFAIEPVPQLKGVSGGRGGNSKRNKGGNLGTLELKIRFGE
mmetsp:Transcript_65457/g.147677  ORF Transcript_65457/g.147677 Transcript_65457/m.147677 type:complete len:201 (-) Transcript_65457:21-623(-)